MSKTGMEKLLAAARAEAERHAMRNRCRPWLADKRCRCALCVAVEEAA
jgi:hypothetical protein